ncbi:MAG: potassium channel family protein [Candidatus Krumholzibacteriota bacterium]
MSESHHHISLFSVARHSRAFVLLFALCAQLLFSGMANQGQIIPVLLRGGIIIAAIFMTADRKNHLVVGLILGIPALILTATNGSFDNEIRDWITYLNVLLLYLFIIRLMLGQIFNARVITLDTIGLALCTYILIGAVWVLFYTPVLALNPNAFSHPIGADSDPLHTLTYFSYVTLATLGYGDISPVSNLARNLAILEAVTGTLFLAVLISRLVGSYSRQSGK